MFIIKTRANQKLLSTCLMESNKFATPMSYQETDRNPLKFGLQLSHKRYQQLVGYKEKGRISKLVLQENKAR